MKKIVLWMIVFSLLLGLASCSAPAVVTAETRTEEATASATSPTGESKTSEAERYPAVSDPLTWEKINSIPIATSQMSVEQLRQICVDYMRLELGFQWTPNETMKYVIREKWTEFSVGKLYAGIPYDSPDGSSGNLYTVMEFLDSETGVLDVKRLGGLNLAAIITNHCSSSCFWGWVRVINTMHAYTEAEDQSGWLNRYMVPSRGFIPVGPYVVEGYQDWYDREGTKTVCLENGEQTMYESYAKVLPGDGCIQYYPKSSGNYANHVQMYSAKPVVVRNSDGTIDGKKSYVTIMEQTSTQQQILGANGETIYIEGRIDKKITFESAWNGGYIPFTFAEFLGTDPVEQCEVSVNVSSGCTKAEWKAAAITSNYPISSLRVETVDPANGQISYSYFVTPPDINCRSVAGERCLSRNIESFLERGHRLRVSVRSGTGEEFSVFEGEIRM